MTTARGIALHAVGLEDVERDLSKMERRLERERQAVVIKAARPTVVAAIKAAAPNEADRRTLRVRGGKADARATGRGVSLKAATTARRGRNGTVLVGPRGGKRGVWFRHITIGGARPHQIPRSGRPLLAFGGRVVTGPVPQPGRAGNPFVRRGADAAYPKFLSALADQMYKEAK